MKLRNAFLAVSFFVISGFSSTVIAASCGQAPEAVQGRFNDMMQALVKDSYSSFVTDSSETFRQALTPAAFAQMSKTLQEKLDLQAGYRSEYVTDLRQGAITSYVWRLTLHDGNQILMQLSMRDKKVVGLHLI
ncbi:hypothetical protein ACSSZE_07725 [Acidithiobacillus caldus]